MTITGFNPIIVSKNADAAIKVFKELGFEQTHAPVTKTETGENHTVRLKDSNGL